MPTLALADAIDPPTLLFSASGFNVSVVPSSVNGAGPLMVVFDASGTTSTYTSIPFHEHEYRWDFGDATSGSWGDQTTGAAGSGANVSRNLATGPIAAHVFHCSNRSTCSYKVCLRVRYGAHVSPACGTGLGQMPPVTITVTDPDVQWPGNRTTCVSSRDPGVFVGCPAGATQVGNQNDWPTIIRTFARPGHRVLLNGGDTFTGDAKAAITAAGPGYIGSYGTGQATVRTTGTTNYSTILNLNAANDWRIADLKFDGQGDIHRQAISGRGSMNRILLLRLLLTDLGGGIEMGLNKASVPDQLALVDSTVRRLTGGGSTSNSHGILAFASRFAVVGNLFDDSTGGSAEHMIRIPFMDRGVISNNQVQKVKSSKEMLSLRSPCLNPAPCLSRNYFPSEGLVGSEAITRKVVISDNLVKTNSYIGISVNPVTTGDLAGFKDIIIERNFLPSAVGGGTSIGLSSGVDSVTIRNNIADTTLNNTGANGNTSFVVGGTTSSPAPNNVWFYNNTTYDGAAVAGIVSLRVLAGATNVIAKNNLSYAPNGTAPVFLSDATAAVASAGNSTNLQVRNASAPFTKNPPIHAINFRPICNESYPCTNGTAVPVWSDFFLAVQPSPRYIGAVKYPH